MSTHQSEPNRDEEASASSSDDGYSEYDYYNIRAMIAADAYIARGLKFWDQTGTVEQQRFTSCIRQLDPGWKMEPRMWLPGVSAPDERRISIPRPFEDNFGRCPVRAATAKMLRAKLVIVPEGWEGRTMEWMKPDDPWSCRDAVRGRRGASIRRR